LYLSKFRQKKYFLFYRVYSNDNDSDLNEAVKALVSVTEEKKVSIEITNR